MRRWLKALLLPPGLNLWVAVLGVLLLAWHPALGYGLVCLALAVLYLCSTGWFVRRLRGLLCGQVPAFEVQAATLRETAEVLVLLSAGRVRGAGADRPSELGYARLRHGAALARATGLPLLITGGSPGWAGATSEAQLLDDELWRLYGMRAHWLEHRARTTWGNARYSAELLSGSGIARVALVTHAWHLPRARCAFERTQLTPLAAPVEEAALGSSRESGEWRPSASALRMAVLLLHEALGLVWYRYAVR